LQVHVVSCFEARQGKDVSVPRMALQKNATWNARLHGLHYDCPSFSIRWIYQKNQMNQCDEPQLWTSELKNVFWSHLGILSSLRGWRNGSANTHSPQWHIRCLPYGDKCGAGQPFNFDVPRILHCTCIRKPVSAYKKNHLSEFELSIPILWRTTKKLESSDLERVKYQRAYLRAYKIQD